MHVNIGNAINIIDIIILKIDAKALSFIDL
jgi:hypothetical protein